VEFVRFHLDYTSYRSIEVFIFLVTERNESTRDIALCTQVYSILRGGFEDL